MNEYLQKLSGQFKDTWNGLSVSQRSVFALILAVFIIGLGGIIVYSSRPQYAPLYSDISEAEAATVVKELDAMGVAYRIDGAAILVNRKDRDRLRLEMSNRDAAPSGGLHGYETLFDFNLGMTRDQQERQANIARSSEIARAIKLIEGIDDAKVEVAIPPQRIYSEEETPVKASVVLTLLGRQQPSQEQMYSIIKLVANSVPDLEMANISITDNHARNLTPELPDTDDPSALKSRQDEVVEAKIKGLEHDVRQTLSQILGADKFTVEVTMEMDFDRVNIAKTEYTSPGFEQLMESQENVTEEFTGMALEPGGTPGVDSNIPTYAEAGQGPVEYHRKEDRTNYHANETVTNRTVSPTIKRLTASVTVDGTWKVTKDERGFITDREYAPRTPEEMANIEEMVKHALGYDNARGDMVSVTNIQFDRSLQFADEDAMLEQAAALRKYKIYGLAAMLALILMALLLVELKTYLQLKNDMLRRQRELAGLPPVGAEIDKSLIADLSLEEKEKMELRRRAEKAAKDDPEMVANLIRTWMLEGD